MTPEEIIRKHRRHVELSPGAGEDLQKYAIAVCDDILSDLQALRPETRVSFDEWFAVMPHPAMSPEEIAEMRRSYEFAWNAAMANVALPEVERTIPAEDCIFGKCPGCGAEFAVLKPQQNARQEKP